MTLWQKFLKRSFDLVASFIGLVLLFFPGLILAIAVKLSSKGSVLFSQKRVGKNGKIIICHKFRTMFTNSEAFGSITSAGDMRITPIGKFLRKSKLDELPQLWNVFTGEMSFVGPRPDVPGYADMLQKEARKILELQPGITGLASLYFRHEEELLASVNNPREYNDTIIWPKKVALNMKYLQEWSFGKDIGYIFITVIPILDKWFKLIPVDDIDNVVS